MSRPAHWFIRGRLKTRQLLLLVSLADEGNLHRAAQALNMTQPAASKLLKDLEDALQVPLFERLPRGVRPTWYGDAMIRHARMVLASLDQAHDEVEALKAGHIGRVSIGAINPPALALLPGAIAQAKREHPGLRISLDVETSPVLLDRMTQGLLDIVVARLGADRDKRMFHYEHLTEEPISAMVRNGHPLLAETGLQLADLADCGWIVPPEGSILRHRFDLMFQEAGMQPPDNIIETTALLFMTRMLQRSDLVAVVSAEVASYYAAHGMVSVLPLALSCDMDAFGIITRRDRLASPGARVLMRTLKDACLTTYGLSLAQDAGPA